jgi:hypothetical protein
MSARSRINSSTPGRGIKPVICGETFSMAPSNPLANWEKIGDSFYRKIAVYDAIFEEDVELENYIAAGAPYGGAIGKNAMFENRIGTDLKSVSDLS